MRGKSTAPAIAAKQSGVFTRAQARSSGFSEFRVRRLIEARQWLPVLGVVLREVGTELNAESHAWAAVLAVKEFGVASHSTAARLHDLVLPGEPEFHVTVPPPLRLRVRRLRTHRVPIEADEITTYGSGLNATNFERTVVDCLLWYPERFGRAMLHEMLRKRSGDLDTVRDALARARGRHGSSRAWAMMINAQSGAHAESEAVLHRIFHDAAITGWKANVEISVGGNLIAIADVLFARAMLIVEIDGRAWHSDEIRFQRDRTRQNDLVNAGYTILRFTWDDLIRRPNYVVSTVRRALERIA